MLIQKENEIECKDLKIKDFFFSYDESKISLGCKINEIFKIITKNTFLLEKLIYLEDKQEFFMELNLVFFMQDLSHLYVDTLIQSSNKIFYTFIGFKFTEIFLTSGSVDLTFSKILEEMNSLQPFNFRLIEKYKEIYDYIKQGLGKILIFSKLNCYKKKIFFRKTNFESIRL